MGGNACKFLYSTTSDISGHSNAAVKYLPTIFKDFISVHTDESQVMRLKVMMCGSDSLTLPLFLVRVLLSAHSLATVIVYHRMRHT